MITKEFPRDKVLKWLLEYIEYERTTNNVLDKLAEIWPVMSLRDYLAAKAMQGIIISGGEGVDLRGKAIESAQDIAECAYDQANEMLKMRKQ